MVLAIRTPPRSTFANFLHSWPPLWFLINLPSERWLGFVSTSENYLFCCLPGKATPLITLKGHSTAASGTMLKNGVKRIPLLGGIRRNSVNSRLRFQNKECYWKERTSYNDKRIIKCQWWNLGAGYISVHCTTFFQLSVSLDIFKILHWKICVIKMHNNNRTKDRRWY